MIFLRFPFHCDLKFLNYEETCVPAGLINDDIQSYMGYGHFSLLCNGKQVHDGDVILDNSTVQVIFSLPGGKGGFGSMLRAIGAQIEKTTNREACRDLSGRRLRDINEEQRLKKWIAKEAEREAEKIKRRQARIERLKSKAPHNFFDFEYEKEISELPNRINDALSEGLQKAKQPSKRPLENPKLPKKSWLSDDLPVSSSDSESGETSYTDGSPSKKLKVAEKMDSSYDSEISDSSQSVPGCSKNYSFAVEESSTSCDSKATLVQRKNEENSIDANNMPGSSKDFSFMLAESSTSCDSETTSSKKNDSVDIDSTDLKVGQMLKNRVEVDKHNDNRNPTSSDMEVTQTDENKGNGEEIMDEGKSTVKDNEAVPKMDNISSHNEPETKDDSPLDLLHFQGSSELEALGLDKLKLELMTRGLKCGGTLADRAQRLWKVRSLKPHEYPANLLAKSKK